MGTLNNQIEITKLKKSGGGVSPEIEEELQELSDDVVELTTNLNALSTYSELETKIGSWIDGSDIYRKIIDIGTSALSIDYTTRNINSLANELSLKYPLDVRILGVATNFFVGGRIIHISGNWYLSTDLNMGEGQKYLILEYTKNEE